MPYLFVEEDSLYMKAANRIFTLLGRQDDLPRFTLTRELKLAQRHFDRSSHKSNPSFIIDLEFYIKDLKNQLKAFKNSNH